MYKIVHCNIFTVENWIHLKCPKQSKRLSKLKLMFRRGFFNVGKCTKSYRPSCANAYSNGPRNDRLFSIVSVWEFSITSESSEITFSTLWNILGRGKWVCSGIKQTWLNPQFC